VISSSTAGIVLGRNFAAGDYWREKEDKADSSTVIEDILSLNRIGELTGWDLIMGESDYRVMLVEDEIPIREGIRDVIEWESLGYTFLAEAKNGKEALDLFDNLAPDVVITDIHMPKLDGLSLTSAIRERTDETKIIILTGFDDFEYARTALKLKATDYLLKPVSPQELTNLLVPGKERTG
jgi:CheY-like chemotaxis protein